jgi:hypothetical protein
MACADRFQGGTGRRNHGEEGSIDAKA